MVMMDFSRVEERKYFTGNYMIDAPIVIGCIHECLRDLLFKLNGMPTLETDFSEYTPVSVRQLHSEFNTAYRKVSHKDYRIGDINKFLTGVNVVPEEFVKRIRVDDAIREKFGFSKYMRYCYCVSRSYLKARQHNLLRANLRSALKYGVVANGFKSKLLGINENELSKLSG